MNPREITVDTEIEKVYHYELFRVRTPEGFRSFLEKWKDWLEPDHKDIVPEDWPKLFDILMATDAMTMIFVELITNSEKLDTLAKVAVPPKIFLLFHEAKMLVPKTTTGALYLRKMADNTLEGAAI